MSDRYVIERARKAFQRDRDAWGEIYQKAADDLHFLSDAPNAQWDDRDYNERVNTGRPALTIDQLGQFVHQVANDIRINTPTINIIPSDNESSESLAEVYKGLIRDIEYSSYADAAYDTASLNAIKCSIGFIRVDHDWDGDGFQQKIIIKRVVNPLSVWIDCDSVEPDGSDAKHGTVIDTMTVAEFKQKFPKFSPVSFDAETQGAPLKDQDEILVAEHFVVEETTETITSEDGTETRELTKRKIKRYKLSGADIIEETTFPGEYIPLIPVYGEESWIKGKRNLYSLIRKSKSAQQMFNYWKSLETELLQKAPQAPVMAAVGQTEDFAEDWKNPSKTMVLRYIPSDSSGNLIGAPQRLEPPTIPTGIVNAARATVDDIKATMGIYNASLGQRSNEQSGIAIRQRQAEGDVATFHFADNLVRSITQVGRVIVCMIPVIYGNKRVLMIRGKEDESRRVGVNGAIVENQPMTFDLTKGKYNVRVTTGGSFTTKRQEAAEFLSNMVSSNPDLLNVMGDLLFKNLDFSGASVMAERMKKVVDPKFLQESEGDPAIDALNQQLQQQQQLIEAMQAELQNKNGEMELKVFSEKNDVNESQAKLQLQLIELQMAERKNQAELILREQELTLKAKELQIKEMELQQAQAVQMMSPMVGDANLGGINGY